MKNKSSKHKETNTFKFQPFAERISAINVDIFHRVEHEYESLNEEADECHFHQVVEKWNVLNLTQDYYEFKKEVKAYAIVTLPQLLHQKDTVIEVLIKHLKQKNPLSLQPLLDIVVAIVRDLRNDFYPYYPQFLDILIELLKTQDTEQLEWTFHCLAYIFKFLWRALIKDINTVFKTLHPLLSDHFPEYINNFAAESFAFVARKVKDRPAFLELILKAVKKTQDGQTGCGRLLFEVVNGINGQFHSCAETMLPFLLGSLANQKLPQGELFEILEHLIGNIVTNIEPSKSELLWKTYHELLNPLIEDINKIEISKDKKPSNKFIQKGDEIQLKDELKLNNTNMLLMLIGQTVEHKKGKFLQKPALLIGVLMKIFKLKHATEEIMLNATKIVILLLLSKHVALAQEQVCNLITSVLNLNNINILLYFVENSSTCLDFEISILPTFLKACVERGLKQDLLKVLTKLVLAKLPRCESGIDLLPNNKYKLDFSAGSELINKQVMDYIKQGENSDVVILAIINIPHLFKPQKFKSELLNMFMNTSRDLDKTKLFKLHLILESLIYISKPNELLVLKKIIFQNILPLCRDVDNIVALKILDLFVTILGRIEGELNEEILNLLHPVLENNFCSPYRPVRLLTSHIYSLFENTVEFETIGSESWNIFSIIYKVESLPVQIDTYRDQLQYLEKFTFEKPQMQMCLRTKFKYIPLKYLCGVLYINFSLLWEPVIDILTSNAEGFEVNVFWEMFFEQLKIARDNWRNPPVLSEEVWESDCQVVSNLFEKDYKIEDKPDFENYRLLLWNAMGNFPSVAESRTRDTSELFLNFIEEEYMKSDSDMSNTCNIKENTTEAGDETVEMDEDEEEDETEKTKKVGRKNMGPKPKGKKTANLLLHHLTVFSKIRSPKSMYREQDLHKLYFELITHKNPLIQKAAMDCILTYKSKHLTPYQTNLYNLIDSKKFKDEIIAFKIDKDSDYVQAEHREELIPIVMRVVFSKMVARAGMRTGGKSAGQQRRNLIFRFLGGCQEGELMNFFKMAFRYYLKYLSEDIEEMVAGINVDLEKFIPPKRLQSTLNLLGVVLEQLGNLMGDDLLKFVLKIILCVGSFLKGVNEQIDQVHSGYHSVLRSLRTNSIQILERFFNNFEEYAWEKPEINAIFDVLVFPYLNKLNIEGIHSPTTLLKLICLWGSNPKYFPLLVKHKTGDEDLYPLKEVVCLLINPKSHLTVYNLIMEMIEKLVSLIIDQEEEKVLRVDNVKLVEKDILRQLKTVGESNLNLNYGSCILLPHAPLILEKIKSRLRIKGKQINKTELFILSRISELVWEDEISDTLLEILFPVILKKSILNASEDSLMQLVTTVYNLLKNLKNPEKHLKAISPLFGYISYPQIRKLLKSALKIFTKPNPDFRKTLELIEELNAYDVKWIDQPDFDRRLSAFKQITTSESFSLEEGVLIIYNCYYMISIEKDLSMRENASHCLKHVTPILIKACTRNHANLSYVLDEIIFNLIKHALRSKNNDLRNELISLLGHLSRECADSHVIFRDLNKLTNKNDLEVDFFENLIHLQTHRQSRALQKITVVFKEEPQAPNMKTLVQFLLPISSHYLCVEKFMNKHNLIDSSIEAIGTICRLLPWQQYEGVLKFYLLKLRNKLEFQKQLVKLVVRVLDAFHFDLSKAEIDEKDFAKVGGERKKVEGKTNNANGKGGEKNEEAPASGDVEENGDVKENDGEDKAEEEIDEFIEDKVEDKEEVEDEEKVVLPFEKITVLCKSSATRITKIIRINLLPQLHRSMAEMRSLEGSHKFNKKYTRVEKEEEDLSRIPISLAVVKLLHRLPKLILDHNLPAVFMKICTFLKSQLESVRRTARETLQKIMTTLGPEYLGVLLGEMVAFLSRGYQVHVLVYTIHAVLTTLKDMYKPSDIDKVLLTVVEICTQDLFGALAEEKEVGKITSKTSEAKSSKSCDTFQILAQYITEKCLMDLLLPIKTVLATTHSFKTVNKAQECLRHIALGLVDNTFIKIEDLLKFAYGTSSESIPQLLNKEKNKPITEEESRKLQRQKPDCFIIPPNPVYRSGFRLNNVKCNAKTNAHFLVEFGIRLVNFMLKRDLLKDESYKQYLDPFVEIFKNCLSSQHVKLSAATLQCLQWVLKYDLPSMRENVEDITTKLFTILHKYGSAGLSKGDNFDLVVAAFKAMSVLVRDVKYHTIDTDQLKILLLYVEQDLHDYEKQAIAFGLLKAIISRKLNAPEIDTIMFKVAELSITSELTHVRLQSRVVFHQYIMEYPLKKKLEKHVNFYLAQLDYEMQSGRESAIEMIQTFINSFPMNVLKEYSGPFFVSLGARLVNDDVASCRKMVGECLSSLIQKLSSSNRTPLFEMILLWLKESKVEHKQLAAQLCGIFITVEKESFVLRLKPLLPLLLLQFGIKEKPGKFVLLKNNEFEAETVTKKERAKDHHLYQVLQMMLKLCSNCPEFLKQVNFIENLTVHVQTLLGYPHDWVRLTAAQFIGYVLSSMDAEKLGGLLVSKKKQSSGYLYSNPVNGVKSLTLDLCAQLQPEVKDELAHQVIKNLVFIARVLQKVPITSERSANGTEEHFNGNEIEEDKSEDEDAEQSKTTKKRKSKVCFGSSKKKIKENDNETLSSQNNNEDTLEENDAELKINLLWLIKRLRKTINNEIIENANSTILRGAIFKWIAAVFTSIDMETLRPILHHFLAPLVREMITTEESNAPLRQLSKEIAGMVKKKIGMEEYTLVLNRLQQNLSVRRAERKRNRSQLAVTDPEAYAKKKIKLNEKKKEAKKKKIGKRKGFVKRKRGVDLEKDD